jgi:hypothetical protein
MDDKLLWALEQVRQFVDSSQVIKFTDIKLREKHHWEEEILNKFKYQRLKKAVEGVKCHMSRR